MDTSTARSQIEQFKAEKYQFDSKTGLCNLPEDAKSDYDNALKILSEQLYSKDIHFIFELIQNAEDNHYREDVVPELSFELLSHDPTNTPGCNGCLVIKNNEVGFNINNIKAISSIGKSTKANQKDAGYIGEKGIGFKSVFVVSPAPHILSNGFKIKFLKDDPKTGLGYIVPYWLENDLTDFVSDNYTTLLLPLQDKQGSETRMIDKVQNELSKLSAELVLFLRKLKKLSIKTPSYFANYHLAKEGEYVELNVQSSNGDTTSKYLLKNKVIDVQSNVVNELRANVTKRDISLAFPVGFELDESPLYCYLPTESDTGLPFLVNADFILSASRESIRQDLTWNSWMRDEVATFSAKTLADILAQKGDITRWEWVPIWGPNRVLYWNSVREKVEEALKVTKCIPTISGKYQLPSKTLSLGKTFKFLNEWPLDILERLTVDLFWSDSSIISKVSSAIGLKAFSQNDFVSLLEQIQQKDKLSDEQLMPALVEITQQKGQWGGSKKYGDFLRQLRSCNLFRCDSGLQNSKYKNLYLPSLDKHEVPVLLNNNGESTQPNYIDKIFYNLMPAHVSTSITSMFNIEEVHAVSYLENSIVKFLKDNANQCIETSLEALSKYLIENIDELPEETVELLSEVLPLKDTQGVWKFPKGHTRFVAPSIFYESPNWQYIYQSKEELQHIVELSEDYLSWVDEELAEQFLDAFDIDDFVTPFVISVHNSAPFLATPKTFLSDDFWKSEDHRRLAFQWLYQVYIDEDSVTSNSKNELELGYFLLNHKWLLSTNDGFVKPSSLLHCFSASERSIFGSSLNYLQDTVTKDFASKLSLVTEPTPKGFMDQIKASKSHSEINKEFLISAYESLANWKDPGEADRIKRRLSQDKLIYLPEPRNQWVSPENVIWESKPELGASFIGLSEYLPERLKYYFVDTLLIKEFHGIESYYAAYKALSNHQSTSLPVKEMESRLNAIARKLSQFIRDEDFVADVAWNSFRANNKVYTDKRSWLDANDDVFIADDGKIKEQFSSHGSVNFTWSSAPEFFVLLEALGVKKASEYINVNISEIRNKSDVEENNISLFAKKAICLFLANYLSFDEELSEKLSGLYHSRELLCDQLTVKYTLDENHYVEVTNELGVYEPVDSSLILVADHDIDDIKDEIALSIARNFFGRKAKQHESSVRVLIDIQTESRLVSQIKKHSLELEGEKADLIEAVFSSNVFDTQATEDTDSHTGEEENTSEEYNVYGVLEGEEDRSGSDEAEQEINDSIVDETTQENSDISDVLDEQLNEESDDLHADADNSESYENTEASSDTVLPNQPSNDVPHEDERVDNSSNNVEAEKNQSVDDEPEPSYSQSSQNNTSSNEQESRRNSDSSAARERKTLSLNRDKNSDKKNNTSSNSTDNSSNYENSQSSKRESSSIGFRLFSYVESDQTHERSEKAERDDKTFGDKAELYVKQWLIEQGFLNVELLGGTNKGFDIHAIDADTGELIFIEVKGQRGPWNRTGIALSKSQMEKCIVEGNSYWLIVVENLLTNPLIHKFVNPASLIDRYYFDSNWSKVADLLKSPEPQKIELDDLFFDETTKQVYQELQEQEIQLPEVGFEISNSKFEVIAELEFAWPENQIGIYLEEPESEIKGWKLFSLDEIEADISPSSELITALREG